jgi:hypothetical protein
VALLNRHRESSAVVAGALIVVLFVAGLPTLSGVVLTATEGTPAFTVDICHPLPSLTYTSGFSAVPLNDVQPSLERPLPSGMVCEAHTSPVIRASEAPDPPPPRSLG